MNYFAPDMTAGNAEKDSPEYGLKMARFIESEWSLPRIQERRAKMKLLRSHMDGTVDASHLKPMFKNAKDLSAMRVNWKYSSEVPRIVNSIIEGFSYDKYRTSVKGVDMHSQEKRSRFRREKMKAMVTKQEAEALTNMTGMDFRPQGMVPQSMEELNLYMELEYKQATEIAAELGIQKVMDYGEWRETFNHIAEDLALFRTGVAKVVPDPQTALKFEYVDPESFIYSQNVEKNRNYSEAWYFGQYMRMPVTEFERMTKGKIPPEKLEQLIGRYGYTLHKWESMSEEEKEISVDVIRFCFKTNRYDIKKKKYNKHGGYKYIDKDDYWTPPENMKSEVVRIPYEVWYEGLYVPGTDFVANYGLMDNMMREPKNARKAVAPYILYRLSSEAIGEKIAEICDDIYITQIKLRQLTVKMKPKGFAIDIDGLGDLDLADGTKLSTLERVRIMREDGDLLFSGSSLVDEMQNVRSPIHDLPDGTGQDLVNLLNVYNHHMSRLHQITGINPQASGAAPPSRTSADVYQGTLAASQRVVNNIFNGLLSIQKRAGEAILARLHSASMLGETEDIITSILGEYTTNMIKEVANLKHYQFIVNVDLKATDEERRELIESLAGALQTGSIAIEDKIDIEEIENLRLAKQMIKLRQKARREQAERDAAINHQRQLEQMQAAEQAKLQREQAMAEIENMKATAEYEMKARLQAFESQAKLREISLKGQWDVAEANIRARAQHTNDAYKEDRKDERLNQQSTHQSELIEQRQYNTRPKTFEKPKVDNSGIDEFEGLTPNI
jgi:hypothetical protein